MPTPRIRATDMQRFTVDDLAKLAAKAKNPDTRQVLLPVAMTANGIPARLIARTLGCCYATVCRRVHCGATTASTAPRSTGAVASGVFLIRCSKRSTSLHNRVSEKAGTWSRTALGSSDPRRPVLPSQKPRMRGRSQCSWTSSQTLRTSTLTSSRMP